MCALNFKNKICWQLLKDCFLNDLFILRYSNRSYYIKKSLTKRKIFKKFNWNYYLESNMYSKNLSN